MSNDLWRWADPEGQQRRVRLDELRSALAGGLIAPNTPVWRAGWKAWQPAHEVPELTTSAVAAANGVVQNIPPPPLAMLAAQHEYERKAGESFVPPPVDAAANEEPPPPPRFVPLPVKAPPAPTSSSPVASVPPAPMSSRPAAPVPPGPPASGAPPPGPGAVQLASALPTTLGLPPPPELAQMVAASKEAAAAKASAPPPVPSPFAPSTPPRPNAPPVGAADDGIIEELSGSMLLDEVSARDVVAQQAPMRPPLPGSLPPPTDPILHGDGMPPRDSFGDYVPPRRPGLSAIFEDFKAIKAGQPPKNKLLLGVVGVLALMVLIVFVALVVSAFSSKPSEVKTIASASATTAPSAPPSETAATTATTPTTAETAVAATPPPPVEEPKSSGPSFGDCVVAGDAHIISPRAFIPSAVETLAVPGAIALGFATNGRDSVALTVDPTSLAITNTVKTRATGGDVKRVSPIVTQGKLGVVAEVDKKDRLAGRRVIATANPIDVGVADNAIVWAPHGGASYATLFPLDAEGGPVDAIRGVPLTNVKGVAVTYRRSGAVYVGIAKGDAVLVPAAPTVRIAGLGPQVGSPAIGTSGDAVIVAWADRAAAAEPWQIRWAKVDATGTLSEPRALALPEGGLGSQAMSPSVAGLGNGRFVIAWTEGPVSNHQVRAMNVAADGSPSGGGLSVSAAGLNAGQPQLAIGADGRGVVAFLAKGKAFYEIHATPLTCPVAK